jgi:hypothetical protein
MNIADQASLVSIEAQMAHLQQVLRRLPGTQFLPPAERAATLAARSEMAREVEELAREAHRLERARRRDN